MKQELRNIIIKKAELRIWIEEGILFYANTYAGKVLDRPTYFAVNASFAIIDRLSEH